MSARGYFTRPLLTIFCLEITGGLPLALTAATLAPWLSEAHIDKAAIGLFAAMGLPYVFKFLWAPAIDGLRLPFLCAWLGRRRGWLIATQILLALAIFLLACSEPQQNAWLVAFAALLVAFVSATQDIVIDAYRVEILEPDAQGQGAAMAQLGYRAGMLLSGAGALYLATAFGWHATYIIMSACMAIGIVTTLVAREPQAREAEPATADALTWLKRYVIEPFADFMTHKHWLLIILFIVTYRLADAFIGIMTNPFLLETGFAKTDIANVVKIYGTVATLIGTFAGGWLTARLGAMRVMLLGGILHALTNLLYAAQAQIGADVTFLAASVMLENISGGIAGAAFVAYLSELCNLHYTATQYALLSAVAAVARTFLATPAGWVAKILGWEAFFIFSALLALPGIALLLILRTKLVVRSA